MSGRVEQSVFDSSRSRSATGVLENIEIETCCEPELEQHPLDPTGLGVEHLASVRR